MYIISICYSNIIKISIPVFIYIQLLQILPKLYISYYYILSYIDKQINNKLINIHIIIYIYLSILK